MNDFKDIKSNWELRAIPEIPKDGYQAIIQRAQYIRRKQLVMQMILIATVIILLYFFVYVSGFKSRQLTYGILLMIGSLLIRVGIEFFSKRKFKSLIPTLQVKEFNEKIIAYHQSRLTIHYVFTPILFAAYVIGFTIMLPVFKLNLSPGFYNYIVFSAIATFIFLIILIVVQIKKELIMINEMKRDIDNVS